jgi:hypothetical protein
VLSLNSLKDISRLPDTVVCAIALLAIKVALAIAVDNKSFLIFFLYFIIFLLI